MGRDANSRVFRPHCMRNELQMHSSRSSSTRRITVIGRDAALWLTVCTLKKALAPEAFEIIGVELPSRLREPDAYTTHPALEGLHRRLGVDENRLLAACGGVYHLGYNAVNFARAGEEFFIPHGDYGHVWDGIPFHKLWLSARRAGLSTDLCKFSLNAAAARQGRMLFPTAQTQAFQTTDYGYVLRAVDYVAFLRSLAVNAGTVVHASHNVDAKVGLGNQIDSIVLHDGTNLTSDLFIDASGDERALAKLQGEAAFLNWTDAYPFIDRVTLGVSPLEQLPAYSEVRALSVGVLTMSPLRELTSVTLTYDPKSVTANEAGDMALQLSGMLPTTRAVTSSLCLGRYASSWVGNLIRIGDAFASFDMVAAPGLYMVHAGLVHFISALQDQDLVRAQRQYNAQMDMIADASHVFQLAHYYLASDSIGPRWSAVKSREAPPLLRRRIQSYLSDADIQLEAGEGHRSSAWLGLFAGLHRYPPAIPELDKLMPEKVAKARLSRALKYIHSTAADLQSHDAYLEIHAPLT